MLYHSLTIAMSNFSFLRILIILQSALLINQYLSYLKNSFEIKNFMRKRILSLDPQCKLTQSLLRKCTK